MRTEELIGALASNATPVRVIPPWGQRVATWSLLAVGVALVAVLAKGARADLAQAASHAGWLIELVVTLVVGLGSAGAALALSVPGRARGPLARWLPLAALALWTGLLLQALFAAGGPWAQLSSEPAYLACLFKSVVIGVVPAVAMRLMVRQAAPLRLGWTAGLGALAAFGIGAAAAQVLCPFDRPAHLLLWHLLPVVGLAGLAALAGRRLLGWNHA